MKIGEPIREIYIEPLELPEPLREIPEIIPDKIEVEDPAHVGRRE